jgi:hypothetical protein
MPEAAGVAVNCHPGGMFPPIRSLDTINRYTLNKEQETEAIPRWTSRLTYLPRNRPTRRDLLMDWAGLCPD